MPSPDQRPWLAVLIVGSACFFWGEWHGGRIGAAQRQAADGAARRKLAAATDRVREAERTLPMSEHRKRVQRKGNVVFGKKHPRSSQGKGYNAPAHLRRRLTIGMVSGAPTDRCTNKCSVDD